MMFEMLTGRLPFEAKNSMAALASQVYERAPRLSGVNTSLAGWDELEQIVADLLEKDPDARIQSAGDLLERVRGVREKGNSARVSGPNVKDPERTTVSIGSDGVSRDSRQTPTGSQPGAPLRDAARPQPSGGIDSTFPPEAAEVAPYLRGLDAFEERESDVDLHAEGSDEFDDLFEDRHVAPWFWWVAGVGVVLVALLTYGLTRQSVPEAASGETTTDPAKASTPSTLDGGGEAGAQVRPGAPHPPAPPTTAPLAVPEEDPRERASKGTTAPPEPGSSGDGGAAGSAQNPPSGQEGAAKPDTSEEPSPTRPRKRRPKKVRSDANNDESSGSDKPTTTAPAPTPSAPAISFDDLKDPFS